MEDALARAVAAGELVVPHGPTGGTTGIFDPREGLPHGARSVLRVVHEGESSRCVLLEEGRACAVHRQLGPGRQAAACRLFPRVALAIPSGVSVTLSHYCPTAADLLFDASEPLRIVTDPPAFPDDGDYEGLDARASPGPLLRPGVLLSWDAQRLWEEHVVGLLARGESPDSTIDCISRLAETLRVWTPSMGDFLSYLAGVLRAPASSLHAGASMGRWPPLDDPFASWHFVLECVPPGVPAPAPPLASEQEEALFVARFWGGLAEPVCRWLATRAFASWLLLQGEGLCTFAVGLRVALGVLWAEAARGCIDEQKNLDGRVLREAIRRADLLLVHLADPESLARRLSRTEACFESQ